ncbi:MAG TPA: SLC13 family permease, partial [Candidatus Nanopelagicales bacterium]|nr:SLC13 family permease [Candidatus Nanopelagicales bacterium]
MTVIAWVAVAIFVGAYVLIATERVHRVAASLGGAAIILGLGVTSSQDAFYSSETGVDWDVIFLLLGMMLVVGVLKRTGVFEYMAIRAAKLAGGRPYRVMVLLVLVTAGASALLDNVTTVLLVVPVTLLVCERLGLHPLPFLMAEALASNIGGAATLVGDPPNIIIASRADLTFTDFLVHMLPVVLVVLAAFLVLIRVMFRKSLAKPVTGVDALMALDEREAIKDPRLLLRSGIVLGAILIGFLLQRQTGISPSVVALVGAGIMILISPARPGELVEDVEWETLLFFIGLFILVGALVEVGALEQLAQFMANATDSQVVPTLMVVLIGSA